MFPRIFLLILSFLIVPLGQESKSAVSEKFPFVGVVNSTKLNVRSGQSENFEKLCTLNKGDNVLVLDHSFSWYKIRMPKTAKVFISDKYVLLMDAGQGQVSAKRVNLRAAANVNSTSLGQLDLGTKVVILEKLDGWYRIEPREDQAAWVTDKFVDFRSNDPSVYVPVSLGQAWIQEVSKKKEEPIVKKTENLNVKLSGFVVAQQDPSYPKVAYQIVVDDKPVYFLVAPKDVVASFLNKKVSLEGVVSSQADNPYPYPIFNLTKIKLVL